MRSSPSQATSPTTLVMSNAGAERGGTWGVRVIQMG